MTKTQFLKFLLLYNDVQKNIFHAKTLEEFEKYADIQDKLVDEYLKKCN